MHPAGRFNRVIWRGLMGRKPYPRGQPRRLIAEPITLAIITSFSMTGTRGWAR
jgi:hypothetical protein